MLKWADVAFINEAPCLCDSAVSTAGNVAFFYLEKKERILKKKNSLPYFQYWFYQHLRLVLIVGVCAGSHQKHLADIQ